MRMRLTIKYKQQKNMIRKQLSLLLICFITAFPCLAQGTDGSSLVINEVQVANIDQYIDASNNYGSWIELYNPTSAGIAVDGLYISDTSENLKKHRLSGYGTLLSKGFTVIYFDHNSADGTYGASASKQVRFNLDADGGTIYISNSQGVLITSFDYPAAISRCSYARTEDGGSNWAWTGQPTLGKTNAGTSYASKQIEAPTATTADGFLSGTKTIYVTAAEGATVRYTTDGSTPTYTNGTILGGDNISISKTTILRLRAFKDGYLPSAVTTHSYLYADKNYSVPIVSISTNPKNLYDNTIGVYCTGTNGVSGRGISYKSNKNMDWERPVNFEYYDKDGNCHLNQEATFKVSGGWSRHWEPTSFKLKAHKQYEGMNFFDCAFFKEKPFIKNKCVLLRNGGNDTWSRSKDATIQHIIQSSGVYVDGQAFNPCHVLLNGVYLATLNMREPSNKFYGYANYGYDTDYMDAFELSPDFGGQVLKDGTSTAWTKLLSLASNASNETNWAQIRDEYLDIDEFINYMAAECWIGCSDWLTNNNNTKWFRSTEGGKFRFVMFDTDSAFDNSNMLGSLKSSTGNNVINLFNRLAKNTTFKNQFITAFCIIDGAVFTKARAAEAAQFVGSAMESAMSLENRSPWESCNNVANTIGSSSTHTTRINSLRNYFSLGAPMAVKLNCNISEAVLTINDLPVPGTKFDGKLFSPAVVKATAPAGYNFVGWRIGTATQQTIFSKGSTWSYYDKGSLDNTDWKTGDISSWKNGAAPLGYSKDGLKTTLSYGSDANNKRPTYYFRSNLNLEDVPGYDSEIILNYTVDDGFAIYVNGVEAGRYNLASGAKYSTYANTYAEGNPDSGSITLSPSLFKKGNNIIAVEVHNNSGSSTDIYWDAEIVISSCTEGEMIEERELNITSGSISTYTAVFEPLAEEYLAPAGSAPVVINEVSASNSVFINDYFKKNDWVELYNTTSVPIDVAGMYLSDDESKPQKYQIMAGTDANSTIIPAHGHLIIWADKLDPLAQLHATFKLGNADGEMVMLTAEDGSWSDKLIYMTHTGEESVGRYPDGGKQVYKMSRPTIGKQNILTTYATWISGEDKNFDVDEYLAAIEHVSENITETIDYYTIDGIHLNGPQKGINIVRKTNADGSVTTKKILIK